MPHLELGRESRAGRAHVAEATAVHVTLQGGMWAQESAEGRPKRPHASEKDHSRRNIRLRMGGPERREGSQESTGRRAGSENRGGGRRHCAGQDSARGAGGGGRRRAEPRDPAALPGNSLVRRGGQP